LKKFLKENKVQIGMACCVLGTAALILVVIFIPIFENLPSEERCNKYYGNDSVTRNLAGQWYCEYDGNAWHYNKTAYSQKMLPGLFT